MATIYNQVDPTPGIMQDSPTYRGGHGLLGLAVSPYRMLGRALGANQVTPGGVSPEGLLTPPSLVHPGRDATFNASYGADYIARQTQLVNEQNARQLQNLQLIKADTESEIAKGNNKEANEAKLRQIDGTIAESKARLDQTLGVDTKNNVANNNASGIDAMNAAATQEQLNTGQRAAMIAKAQGTKEAQISLEQGYNAQNRMPAGELAKLQELNVPGVGAYKPNLNGGQTALLRGGEASNNTSTPNIVHTPYGDMPMGVNTKGSASTAPATVIQSDPEKLAQVTDSNQTSVSPLPGITTPAKRPGSTFMDMTAPQYQQVVNPVPNPADQSSSILSPIAIQQMQDAASAAPMKTSQQLAQEAALNRFRQNLMLQQNQSTNLGVSPY